MPAKESGRARSDRTVLAPSVRSPIPRTPDWKPVNGLSAVVRRALPSAVGTRAFGPIADGTPDRPGDQKRHSGNARVARMGEQLSPLHRIGSPHNALPCPLARFLVEVLRSMTEGARQVWLHPGKSAGWLYSDRGCAAAPGPSAGGVGHRLTARSRLADAHYGCDR
jgi:hypothetical protein